LSSSALPEIVEHQRWQRSANHASGSAGAEVAQCRRALAAGDGQEHCAEHGEPVPARSRRSESRAADRSTEYHGAFTICDSQHGDRDEPQHHHRSEEPADAVRRLLMKNSTTRMETEWHH
jgi:hypothetical protein